MIARYESLVALMSAVPRAVTLVTSVTRNLDEPRQLVREPGYGYICNSAKSGHQHNDRGRVTRGEDDFQERHALALELGGVPEPYAEAFAHLQCDIHPDIPRSRRKLAVEDGGHFLDRWASEALRLGWSAESLFGHHLTVPLSRFDHLGLIWILRGRRVTALGTTWAQLDNGLTYRQAGHWRKTADG